MADTPEVITQVEILCSVRAGDHACRLLPGMGHRSHTMIVDDCTVHECWRCGQKWISPEDEDEPTIITPSKNFVSDAAVGVDETGTIVFKSEWWMRWR